MTTAREAITYLERLDENEEVFVLRAQDRFAPATIRVWCEMLQGCLGYENHKIWDAHQCADRMEVRGYRKIPD